MSRICFAFEFRSLFSAVKLGALDQQKNDVAALKRELIDAISFTNNGSSASLDRQQTVLNLVSQLETLAPVSESLLSDPNEANVLDGVWFLQYTASSDIGSNEEINWTPENETEGKSKIDTKKYKDINGSVGAAGIVVETANRLTQQIFDVEKERVSNFVEQDFGTVRVGGKFRQSPSVPNRAIVAFDSCEISLNSGITLQLGFLFSLIAVFRGGTKDNGWLETTFLDSELRIGRGNKGSLFILTRDRATVKP